MVFPARIDDRVLNDTSKPNPTPDSGHKRRQYNSPLRERQSAQTRERIIAAGSDLVHGFSAWNWKELTFRAVGERARVSSRTVHRYFPTEKDLRDAVIQRLMQESGIQLDQLQLDNFPDHAAQVFRYLTSFSATPETREEDPTFAAIDEARREALLGAVTRAKPDWPEQQRVMTAAMLDMLWDVPPYARLLTAWRLPPDQAIDAMTWVIGLIRDAVNSDRGPGGTTPP